MSRPVVVLLAADIRLGFLAGGAGRRRIDLEVGFGGGLPYLQLEAVAARRHVERPAQAQRFGPGGLGQPALVVVRDLFGLFGLGLVLVFAFVLGFGRLFLARRLVFGHLVTGRLFGGERQLLVEQEVPGEGRDAAFHLLFEAAQHPAF